MENQFLEKMKDLTLDPDHIKAADPKELMTHLHKVSNYIKDYLRSARIETVNNTPVEFHEEVAIEWGRWSSSFNQVLRERIKEHDLFLDNIDQRFLAKQCNIIYLCWWKIAHYIELANNRVNLETANKMVKALEVITTVVNYFNNMDIKEVQTWEESQQ